MREMFRPLNTSARLRRAAAINRGKQSSTHSVGMSLARPPKAGIGKMLLDLRRVSDD